jgi:SAM-dependent methyltransferase
MNNIITPYPELYRIKHPFAYRSWLYQPFVQALINKAQLKEGCTVLDVGCGQGFFSGLFADMGLKPLGVDVSPELIQSAKEDHEAKGASFEVGDAVSLPNEGEFDCVFVRGLSLYNRNDLQCTHQVTESLLRYLKPAGVMLFAYGTNLCPRRKTPSWTYHSLPAARAYFSRYPGSTVYFSLRLETLVLGSWAFSRPLTLLASLISRLFGAGGELIAVVPRSGLDKTATSRF